MRAVAVALSLLLTQLSLVLCHLLALLSYLSSRSSRNDSVRGTRIAGIAVESLSVGADDIGHGKAAMATGTGHPEYTSLLLITGSGFENMSDNLDTCLASTFLLDGADDVGGGRPQFKGGWRLSVCCRHILGQNLVGASGIIWGFLSGVTFGGSTNNLLLSLAL